jgi:hypothetical protein
MQVGIGVWEWLCDALLFDPLAAQLERLGVPATIHIWMSNALRSGGLEPRGHVSHRVRAVPAFRPR